MALRASDGEPAWRSQNGAAMTHATPIVATIHGVRQVIFPTQSGLVSLNPLTGALLWRTNYPFLYAISLAVSPVIHQDMVFVGGAHAYGMGSVVFRATLTNQVWSVNRLWWTNNPASHWMTPVAHQGFLYGQFGIFSQFDSPEAQLKCINMRTGQVMWSTNGFGRCGTLLVRDRLLVLTERGDLVLAEANTNAYVELGRFRAIPGYAGDDNKCWNIPAIADGRVYVRSTSFGACYDLSMPDLLLDTPLRAPQNRFTLTARTVNGSAIPSNRLTNIELRASTNAANPPPTWDKLTNALLLTNGVLRVTNVQMESAAQGFFLISEPK
jgi:outer membrane protein assembly factor BamB